MAALQRAIANTTRTQGRTALFDAVATGLDYVAHGRHERKVLVVVSDGGDNASRSTLDDVIARTQSSKAVIYTVALDDPLDRDANPKLLKRLAHATGGRAFSPRTVDEIATALQRIAADIRHTYTLGYISTDETRNGSFRSIRLVVHSPDRRPLLVRTQWVRGLGSARSGLSCAAGLTLEERRSNERGTNTQ
jgi:Ca-activated chloride channel family protein